MSMEIAIMCYDYHLHESFEPQSLMYNSGHLIWTLLTLMIRTSFNNTLPNINMLFLRRISKATFGGGGMGI